MKLTIPNKDLQTVLGRVIRTVERKNTIPILANVLLSASDGNLSVKATDLDVLIEAKSPATVESEGRTTVPGHLLRDIASKIKSDASVTLELEDTVVHLRSGRSRFKLQTLPADDFPALEIEETNHVFDLSPERIADLFGRTQFAVSTEQTRYYLNGVYLHTHGDNGTRTLRGVATDGHRLAQMDCVMPQGADGFHGSENKTGVIVPSRTVDEVNKLAKDADVINVKVTPTRIQFATEVVTLTSKLIDGTFPDYCRVVPLGNDKVMRADREELMEAVDRIATVSSERGRAIKLSLDKGKLGLSIVNPDAGSATEELDVEYDREPLEIGFNSRYLCDILAEVKSDVVEILLADPGSPTLIKGRDDKSALFVQMPMRV
jgi:DNA polymerase III subunit beta